MTHEKIGVLQTNNRDAEVGIWGVACLLRITAFKPLVDCKLCLGMVPFVLHKGDGMGYLFGGEPLDWRHDLVVGRCAHCDFTFQAVADNAGEPGNIFF